MNNIFLYIWHREFFLTEHREREREKSLRRNSFFGLREDALPLFIPPPPPLYTTSSSSSFLLPPSTPIWPRECFFFLFFLFFFLPFSFFYFFVYFCRPRQRAATAFTYTRTHIPAEPIPSSFVGLTVRNVGRVSSPMEN